MNTLASHEGNNVAHRYTVGQAVVTSDVLLVDLVRPTELYTLQLHEMSCNNARYRLE